MSDPAIRVQNVSKRFARSLKRAMIYGLRDIARASMLPSHARSKNFSTRASDIERDAASVAAGPANDGLRPSEFWALRNVSFDVQHGECLGVIGHNGAGKSTLFSILSGIYGPSEGRVEIHGRLQAMIALGAGFHPMLSGRENIYINAAILGMKSREIDALLEAIIDFAELGEFIDAPVKNYSSGMMVRLGFAVAINMKPDVLLIDEVLAVGDMNFQNKSFARMMKLVNSGVPVLFVSHSMRAVEMICSKTMWMEHGRVRQAGPTGEVVSAYVEHMNRCEKSEAASPADAGLFPIHITRVALRHADGSQSETFGWSQTIVVDLEYESLRVIESPWFHFGLARPGPENPAFARFSMFDSNLSVTVPAGRGKVACEILTPALAPGEYEIRCGIMRAPTSMVGQKHYQETFTGARFRIVANASEIGRPGIMKAMLPDIPPVLLNHRWDFEPACSGAGA